MNPRLRKEYKHSKNLCPAKEMDLVFLLKSCEMRSKHDGHCPELPTSGPHFPLARVEGTLAFPKTRDSLLSLSPQKDSSCDPWTPRGRAELRAEVVSDMVSRGRARPLSIPAQWWACSDLARSAKRLNPPGQ